MTIGFETISVLFVAQQQHVWRENACQADVSIFEPKTVAFLKTPIEPIRFFLRERDIKNIPITSLMSSRSFCGTIAASCTVNHLNSFSNYRT